MRFERRFSRSTKSETVNYVFPIYTQQDTHVKVTLLIRVSPGILIIDKNKTSVFVCTFWPKNNFYDPKQYKKTIISVFFLNISLFINSILLYIIISLFNYIKTIFFTEGLSYMFKWSVIYRVRRRLVTQMPYDSLFFSIKCNVLYKNLPIFHRKI